MFSRRSVLSLSAAAVLAAAPAMAQQAASTPASTQQAGPAPVRVVSLGGLIGAAAGASADLMAARELAAAEVNQGGGLADGRPLALEAADVGCAGSEAAAAAATAQEVFASSAAVAFLGPVCSDAALAVARAAERLGAPMISDGATTAALSGAEKADLVFRTSAADPAAAAALADLAVARGYRAIAVSHAEDAWARGLADRFAQAARDKGIVIEAMQSFAPGRESYDEEMQALADAAPAEALALFAYAGGDGPAALSAALKLGAWGAVIGGDGLLDDGLARTVGTLKLTRVSLVAPAPDRGAASWKRFAQMARAYGVDPEAPLVAQGYDAAMVMALALVRSGGEGGAKLAEAIREVTRPGAPRVMPGDWPRARMLAARGPVRYMGASGEISFDAAGDVPARFAVWRAHAGQWKPGRLR